MNIIKYFVKHHKILTTLAVVFFFLCISYIMSKNCEEWFAGAENWFNFIYNLGLSYLCAFIFYIMQAYIPKRKEKVLLDELIALKIYRVKKCMIFPILIVYNKVIFDWENYVPDLSEIDDVVEDSKFQQKLDLLSSSNEDNLFGGNKKTYLQVMIDYYEHVEDLIKEIYSLMPYLNIELVKILDEIKDSSYHSYLKLCNEKYSILESSNEEFPIMNEESKSYYCLYNKLKKINIKEL